MTMTAYEFDRIDDASYDAQQFAEQVKDEKQKQLIENEQCFFIDAADTVYGIILDAPDTRDDLNDAITLLRSIGKNSGTFDSTLIEGLILSLSVIRDSQMNWDETRAALCVVLDAMALHDFSNEDLGQSLGQIQKQAKECRDKSNWVPVLVL